jgi:hypothetical protein
MKKLVLVIGLFVIAIVSANAQNISKHAIGIRLGDSNGLGGEISYQHALTENNRLELDLGFRSHKSYDAFKLSGLYQWVWNIDGGFNWYAGVGAGVGSWSVGNDYTGGGEDGIFLNIDGNVGIEYDFDFPLLLSLDIRPEFGIIGDYGNDANFDIALGVRYQF